MINGAKWGCGGWFASVDALAQHHKNEGGSNCIQELIDGDAMGRKALANDDPNRGPDAMQTAISGQYSWLRYPPSLH